MAPAVTTGLTALRNDHIDPVFGCLDSLTDRRDLHHDERADIVGLLDQIARIIKLADGGSPACPCRAGRSRPPIKMRSRQETVWPKTPNSGWVSPTIQAIEPSSARRATSARANPSCRARFWRSAGNRLARIVIKTRLSTVKVRRLAQICGSFSQSTVQSSEMLPVTGLDADSLFSRSACEVNQRLTKYIPVTIVTVKPKVMAASR
jgi:hypothetical protein